MIERAERPDDWAGYDFEPIAADFEYGIDNELDQLLSARGWLSARRGEAPWPDNTDCWIYETDRTVVQVVALIGIVPVVARGYEVLSWTDERWNGNEIFPPDLPRLLRAIPAIERGADQNLEPGTSPDGFATSLRWSFSPLGMPNTRAREVRICSRSIPYGRPAND